MSEKDLYVDNMEVTLSKILPRVLDALNKSNLDDIFDKLANIKGPTLVAGCGGSSVVGEFLASVLRKKNNIIADFKFPRDLKYTNLDLYQNVISISYSGANIGVDASFDNNLNKYLFSAKTREGINALQYQAVDEEFSFVSMAGTFIPLSIILLYYRNDLSLVKEILSVRKEFDLNKANIYEVMASAQSKTAQTMLDSTLVEGALAAAVFHEKYNYCHGRTMFNYTYQNPLIYFEEESDLDTLFKEHLFETYNKVLMIDKKYDDAIINDYYQTFVCLLLCIEIAKVQGKDLSIKEVPDISEILYRYKGSL